MVEVTNLCKRYGDHEALCDVSFSLSEGKIYGLLGPNGAGKSTTMNIMTGYIGASSGLVSIDGLDIFKDAKKAKAKIGYLPELPPLYPDMTVHEYLMFVCGLKGVEKKERLLTVEEVMDETGITDVADRLIKNLSKGYRQRVGFAQAIIGDPALIILDEPTVGLDPKQILEFRELIRTYGKEHIVMISSHILSEIREVCEHVFIISHGKLVADIDMEQIGDKLEETFFALTDAEPEDAADVTTGEDPEEETDDEAEAVVTEGPEADVPESDLAEEPEEDALESDSMEGADADVPEVDLMGEPEEDAPESDSMEGADADVPVDGSTEEPGSDVQKTVLAEGGDTDGSNM